MTSVFDAIVSAMSGLPKSNLARLQPSEFLERGSIYRIAPTPDLTGDRRPVIVIHPKDLDVLRERWREAAIRDGLPFPTVVAIDQYIADAVEQRFLAQEKQTSRVEYGIVTGGA